MKYNPARRSFVIGPYRCFRRNALSPPTIAQGMLRLMAARSNVSGRGGGPPLATYLTPGSYTMSRIHPPRDARCGSCRRQWWCRQVNADGQLIEMVTAPATGGQVPVNGDDRPSAFQIQYQSLLFLCSAGRHHPSWQARRAPGSDIRPDYSAAGYDRGRDRGAYQTRPRRGVGLTEHRDKLVDNLSGRAKQARLTGAEPLADPSLS